MSEAKAGPNHPLFGKRGALSHMFGRTPTAETRQRIRDALKGRVFSAESIQRMSESQKKVNRSGENHPMFGKVPAHAHPILWRSSGSSIIKEFPSKMAAAEWLGVMIEL